MSLEIDNQNETMEFNARDIAVDALRDRAGNVSARVRSLAHRHKLAPADRGLAVELALGVERRKLTLERILRSFLAKPNRKLPTPLDEILLVAIYQILFLDRIPSFAAVNEAVDQAIRFHHKRQKGLVNGVLRTILRNIKGPLQGPARLSSSAVPVSASAHFVTAQAVFTDPNRDAIKYLSQAYSLPESLAKRWLDRFGLEEACKLGLHADIRAPLILRVNRLCATPEQAMESLKQEGVQTALHENGSSIVVLAYDGRSIREYQAFREGWIQPQDPTATRVSLECNARPGSRVLDFCAAPGTKATHLAELMNNTGSIDASDIAEGKLARIEKNCKRMGISIVHTMLAENAGTLDPESYDTVLVDAPCSNTGVLARRAEARWRFSEETVSRQVDTQKSLLRAASIFVKPAGRLVYATCSIEPEECKQIAQWFNRNQDKLSLTSQELILPAGTADPAKWNDGGYFAVFEAK